MTADAADQLVAGHRKSLLLLADTEAVRATLDKYRATAGVEVYLRLTGNGLAVMSLDVANCRSMISIGTRGLRDDLLRSLPPSDQRVATAAAGYLAKRDELGRGSIEERFALELIAGALTDQLRLGGSGWLFLHQEWRLHLPEGPGKIDLLAFDPDRRRLVVIECKATESDAAARDQHGWLAARQADEYAAAIWRARDELYPFFGELARAMGRVYAPERDWGSFELDASARPTTAVWWPSRWSSSSTQPRWWPIPM